YLKFLASGHGAMAAVGVRFDAVALVSLRPPPAVGRFTPSTRQLLDSTECGDALRWVSEDAHDTSRGATRVDEEVTICPIAARPFDGEIPIGLLQVHRFRISVSGDANGKMVGRVQ